MFFFGMHCCHDASGRHEYFITLCNYTDGRLGTKYEIEFHLLSECVGKKMLNVSGIFLSKREITAVTSLLSNFMYFKFFH